jgi:hypothetical protein
MKLFSYVQGSSNMTGTNCDLFTHKSSRSYLNHLVCLLFLAPTYFGRSCDHLQGVPQNKRQEYNTDHRKYIINFSKILSIIKAVGSQDDSVGIATRYGLEGPGIESRWGRDFSHLSRPVPRLTQPPVQWLPGLSRG